MLAVHTKTKGPGSLWIDYAEEFIGTTNKLKNNKVVINYNLWRKDQSYRKAIANELHLNFSDKGLDKVSAIGGGSSFDGMNYSDDAGSMKLFDRWQNYTSVEGYLDLFKDKKIIDLSKKIFELPGNLETFITETIAPRYKKWAFLRRFAAKLLAVPLGIRQRMRLIGKKT
jgi:hypothetical protein